MNKKLFSTIVISLFLLSCGKADIEEPVPPTPPENMYFPPNDGSMTWETKSLSSLGWNENAFQSLKTFLQQKNTKSFMILVNGRIVVEEYMNGHSLLSQWYWASAGKTLTSTVVGIAQEENLININDPVSQYIGSNWTSAPIDKENMITCKHLLTMTSGLDDSTDAVEPGNLHYIDDAGKRWAYANVYVKLQDIVSNTSRIAWSDYFNAKLRDKIGMEGDWFSVGNNSLYRSTTRSMARFGLLALNKGKWNEKTIINENFINVATSTSQNLNLSYGYLWWLNGKSSYRLPQSQTVYSGSLIPTAPNDMFMALGKNDQKIYVIPSKKMVVIRMGEAADNTNMALSNFDNDLWVKIKTLYQ